MLNETNHISDEILSASAEQLFDILRAPTLFHLDGINAQPLFISTLLHGNETTGFYAVQQLLKQYRDNALPRAISLFIGNVAAAKDNLRHLDSQQDYNRIWPGTHYSDSAEKDMMQTVTRIMQKRKPFASIDIHNNTGENPHYACINILNPHCLLLASKFSDIAVYFTSPKGVQSSAFADFCPAVVLECGQSGEKSGVTHALRYLEDVIQLTDLSSVDDKNLKLYHTVARVTIPKTVTMSDNSKSADLRLNIELENRNFHTIQPGTVFAEFDSEKEKLIVVNNESDEDITKEFIETKNNRLIFKQATTLSMFTTCEKAIRQDCVCYFMEELRVG